MSTSEGRALSPRLHADDCAYKRWADRAFGRVPSGTDDTPTNRALRPFCHYYDDATVDA